MDIWILIYAICLFVLYLGNYSISGRYHDRISVIYLISFSEYKDRMVARKLQP